MWVCSSFLDDILTDLLMQDYVDACDRLSQLTLTEQQQREIVRVLVHCCGNVRLSFILSHFDFHSGF